MANLINQRDLTFLLYEWLHAESLCQTERFQQHSRETFDAILQTALQMADEQFYSHAAKLDQNEPEVIDGKVHLIPEVQSSLQAYAEAGFFAGYFPEEVGGWQLPYTICQAYHGIFHAANVSTMGYPFLTEAAANLLMHFGADSLKKRFLPAMLEGRFYGTMCLSEPQAGSSLGDILTTATPLDDGSYAIKGTKMWISGGEHELAENIVHLVLAKVPGGPPGVKGISLFLVPRYHLDEHGRPGPSNDVKLAGINHKMGYRGTINTMMSFGEEDQCKGELIGELHHGLKYMFHMMNEARIGVGLGATMLGYTGYLHALEYARTRTQGRKPGDKDPNKPPIPIIEHTDVKRMLLAQKSYVEGGLALGLYCAMLVDQQQTAPTQEAQQEAGLLLDLLTPIAKAWPSEYCLKANDLAIQVHGGYGYSREYPVERMYRDNRLNPIHEGTNGIQALDLLGRKVTMKQGKALLLLASKFQETIADATHPELQEEQAALTEALERVSHTTQSLFGVALEGNTDLFLANASVYLDMVGHTVIAWLWLSQAITACQAIDEANPSDKAFYQGKKQACRYFFRWELPKTKQAAELLTSLEPTCLNMQDDWF